MEGLLELVWLPELDGEVVDGVSDVLDEGLPDGDASALRSTVRAIAADGTVRSGTMTRRVTTIKESQRRAMVDRASASMGFVLSRPPPCGEDRAHRRAALFQRRSSSIRIEPSPTFPFRDPIVFESSLQTRTSPCNEVNAARVPFWAIRAILSHPVLPRARGHPVPSIAGTRGAADAKLGAVFIPAVVPKGTSIVTNSSLAQAREGNTRTSSAPAPNQQP